MEPGQAAADEAPPDLNLRQGAPPDDFLLECVKLWPSSHALLRAIELRKFWRFTLRNPVLDVGCGDGNFSRLLFSAPLEAGIDLNSTEVRKATVAGVYRQALVAPATRLPFPDKSFQDVFSNCVLEHIDDLDTALREINRVLPVGGRLLASVPTPRWESQGPFPSLRRLGLHSLCRVLNDRLRALWHHVTVEDRDGWLPRLERHGFRLLHWEPYMVPEAYAAYARFLLGSVPTFVLRKLTGRWFLSRRLRERLVPFLADRLRGPYLSEGPVGACAIFLAEKRGTPAER